MQDKKFTERLKQRLTIEFQNQDRSGAYGFTQRSMAYNSNKIEGSTLTPEQTASLFDNGTLPVNDHYLIQARFSQMTKTQSSEQKTWKK